MASTNPNIGNGALVGDLLGGVLQFRPILTQVEFHHFNVLCVKSAQQILCRGAVWAGSLAKHQNRVGLDHGAEHFGRHGIYYGAVVRGRGEYATQFEGFVYEPAPKLL